LYRLTGMHVASLDLCRALYVLAPDWNDTALSWFIDNVVPGGHLLGQPRSEPAVGLRGSRLRAIYSEVPAYDLSYLLWKLPTGYGVFKANSHRWLVFDVRTMQTEKSGRNDTNDTPENVVCAFCIELWRRGTLTR
jgi:hypothetical protein